MNKENGNCPICDARVETSGAEISEIITCSDCKSRLVVKSVSESSVGLEEAPQIEEDWGE